jgi:tetratricopeptide (TPR) repeat protein
MIDHREAMAHVRVALAQALGSAGRNTDAEGHCRSAIGEYEKFIGQSPGAVGYRHRQAIARSTLGYLLHKQGRLSEAEEAYSLTIAELTKLVDEHCDVPSYGDDLAEALARQGELLNSAQRMPDAEQAYRQALAIREKLARDFPSQPEYAHRLAWLLVGSPCSQLHDPTRALAWAERACEFAPDNGLYWVTLGVSHLRAGHPQESISALEKGLELRLAGDAAGWLFLSMAYLQLHDLPAAEDCYQQAIDWMARNKPDDPELLRFQRETECLLAIEQASEPKTRDQ